MKPSFSFIDNIIINFDYAINTITGNNPVTERINPASEIKENELSNSEQKLSAALMRINHAGEVSAQGLYQGQALTAKLAATRNQMHRAALEENDHLSWCSNRCHELSSYTSILSPFWYFGSFIIGATTGKVGDKWSLGFVAETEHQVVKHIDEHLSYLPEKDLKSREILQQMREDELNHAILAENSGATKLPLPIKMLMAMSSKVMTKTAYYI